MTDPIVVVGARVAGAMTALHLARRGHEVVIVDRAAPTSDVLSTHLLMRSGTHQLLRTGLLDDVVETGTPLLRSLTLGFGDTVRTFDIRDRFGVDAYIAPRRTALDPVVLEAAIAAGAEFRAGITVKDVTRDRTGRVDGIAGTTVGGAEIRIPASFVVGADGMRSRVADAVGSQTTVRHETAGGVVYSYFDVDGGPWFDFRYGSDRMTGAATTTDGATLVYSSVPTADMVGETEDIFLRTLDANAPEIADAVRAGDRLERFRRSSGVPTFLRDAHGPGWALVGDAGFMKDPATAHGISCAFRDADLVARAIDGSTRDPHLEHDEFARFQATRDRFARPLIEHGVGLGSFDWDADGAAHHMFALGRVNDDECEWFETLDEAVAA